MRRFGGIQSAASTRGVHTPSITPPIRRNHRARPWEPWALGPAYAGSPAPRPSPSAGTAHLRLFLVVISRTQRTDPASSRPMTVH